MVPKWLIATNLLINYFWWFDLSNVDSLCINNILLQELLHFRAQLFHDLIIVSINDFCVVMNVTSDGFSRLQNGLTCFNPLIRFSQLSVFSFAYWWKHLLFIWVLYLVSYVSILIIDIRTQVSHLLLYIRWIPKGWQLRYCIFFHRHWANINGFLHMLLIFYLSSGVDVLLGGALCVLDMAIIRIPWVHIHSLRLIQRAV